MILKNSQNWVLVAFIKLKAWTEYSIHAIDNLEKWCFWVYFVFFLLNEGQAFSKLLVNHDCEKWNEHRQTRFLILTNILNSQPTHNCAKIVFDLVYLNLNGSFAKLSIETQRTFAVCIGGHFVIGLGLKFHSAHAMMLTCQSLTVVVISAALFNINSLKSISFEVTWVQVVSFVVDLQVANAALVTSISLKEMLGVEEQCSSAQKDWLSKCDAGKQALLEEIKVGQTLIEATSFSVVLGTLSNYSVGLLQRKTLFLELGNWRNKVSLAKGQSVCVLDQVFCYKGHFWTKERPLHLVTFATWHWHTESLPSLLCITTIQCAFTASEAPT